MRAGVDAKKPGSVKSTRAQFRAHEKMGAAQMADLERRITIASINKIRGGWEKPKERLFVGRFRGRASGAVAKTTQFGDYTMFTGSFIAWNKEGDEFIGANLIVPEPAQSIILSGLNGNKGEPVASVEFAFDMFMVPDDDPRNARGYKFVTSTIFDDAGETYDAMRKGLPPLPKNKAIASK